MIFLHLFLLLAIQIALYKESKFKYSHNNELLIERINKGREALDEILKAKKKAEEEYKKKKKRRSADDINSNNIYVKEIKCYEYVLDQLNNLNTYNCNDINENNKSLLALAKTKCIFIKSSRDFPEDDTGCVLNPKNLTKLQIYLYNNNLVKKFNDKKFIDSLKPDVLNQIEKITNPCIIASEATDLSFSEETQMLSDAIYQHSTNENDDSSATHKIRSKDEISLYNKLCENLKYKIITNCTGKKRMSDVAFQIYHSEYNHIDDICFYIHSIEWNKRTEENINQLSDTSAYITRQLTKNLENMKLIENAQTKQIENTNKFDIFLRTLRNDFSDLMQLLIKIKKHHDNFTRFIRAFQLASSYLLVLLFVLIVTSRNQTSRGRKRLFSCVILCYTTEFLFRKLVFVLSEYVFILSPFLISCAIKGIRYSFILIGAKILLRTILTYKEPIRQIEEQLTHIKKIIENNHKMLDKKELLDEHDNLSKQFDNETANILHMWTRYSDYLNSCYSDDSDYVLTSSHYSSSATSSDVSLVSEEEKPEHSEIITLNELPIGKRIEQLHREKRPVHFHYIPSPYNIISFTESPISFAEAVARGHEELMRLREKRIEGIPKESKKRRTAKTMTHKTADDNNDTIVLEYDEQNDTCSLNGTSNHKESGKDDGEKERLHKFYSFNSHLSDK